MTLARHDAFNFSSPPHFDELLAIGPDVRRKFLTFERALEFYTLCCAEAAYWQRTCDAWTRANGMGVWREGHYHDKTKLRQRRLCRWRRRIARQWMIEALPHWQPEQAPSQ